MPTRPARTPAHASGPDRRPLGLHPDSLTPRLYDHVLLELRARELSRETEQAYVGWIHRYLQFHHHQHPARLNQDDLGAFLQRLADDKSSMPQRDEARAALFFLYGDVLPGSFPWLPAFLSKNPKLNTAPTLSGRGRGHSHQTVADSQEPNGQPRLLDRIRHAIRVRHMADSTEKAYVAWARRFILFHNKRHPLEMGKAEVSAFLTHLAVDANVAASTQNQALAALLFLYRTVLERDFGWLDNVVRAKKPKHLPAVFTADEAEAVIGELTGVRWLVGMLLYGGGLRISEGVRSRVKDLDFDRPEITVRDAKGAKDRVTLLPETVVGPLKDHLARVREQHEQAMEAGYGGVHLPFALARKYPNAQFEWGWQYVFPASRPSRDPRSGAYRRHHWDPEDIQDGVRAAIRKLGINKHASCHTFRHTFATELLINDTDIRTVQELMGHKDVRTTQIYTHVLRQNSYAVRSPADRMSSGKAKNRTLFTPYKYKLGSSAEFVGSC